MANLMRGGRSSVRMNEVAKWVQESTHLIYCGAWSSDRVFAMLIGCSARQVPAASRRASSLVRDQPNIGLQHRPLAATGSTTTSIYC